MPELTPVFAPDGTIRSIPSDQLPAAFAAGGKPAVKMYDPQGVQRYVPQDRVEEAKANGGKLVNAGFLESMADEAAKIVANHVKSWLSGGGGIGQESKGPTESFNPFHPVETAGYLVPQPVKDLVNAIRSGNEMPSALGRATAQAVSQAPALLQASLRPEYVSPESAPVSTDIPPSARPMTAGTEGNLMGARGPVAATPAQIGAIKTAIQDVAKGTPNPTIWQALRHPVISAGQFALRKYGQSIPVETEAAPVPRTLPPNASWTGRVEGTKPIEGEPTATIGQPPPAETAAEAAPRSVTKVVSNSDWNAFKSATAKSNKFRNWSDIPDNVKQVIVSDAFGEGGQFEGSIPPPEVSQLMKSQVSKAVDEVIPASGKTTAANKAAKAEATFYVERGDTESAVAAVEKHAGPEFKPWRPPAASSEPITQAERLASAQEDTSYLQQLRERQEKDRAAIELANARQQAASMSSDLTKVAGTEGAQGQDISARYRTLPIPWADMEANKMLGYDPHGIGKPVKLTKTPGVKSPVTAAADLTNILQKSVKQAKSSKMKRSQSVQP